VLRDVLGPLRGHVRVREDGGHRAFRLARAAVDALVRVDVVLVLTLIYAVHRANLDAARILGPDARLGDDVRHSAVPPTSLRKEVSARQHAIVQPPGSSCKGRAWRSEEHTSELHSRE